MLKRLFILLLIVLGANVEWSDRSCTTDTNCARIDLTKLNRTQR